MKKHLLFVFAVLMVVLTSCERSIIIEVERENEEWEDEEQEEVISYQFAINTQDKRIGQENGSFQIRVSSNHEWTVTVQKPTTNYIVKLEIDKCSGNGDGIVTVNYSTPHRSFYYSPGNTETGFIVFHHKKGTNKDYQSHTTTCRIKRVRG